MAPIDTDKLAERLERAYPELATVRDAAGDAPVYIVGGAVRDLLLGRNRADLDLTVVGDAAELAACLGAEIVEHERFATAKVTLDGHAIDIAGARTESYSQPGALPEVTPASSIETDLWRRDFTINAMAIPLGDYGRLIDPHGGRAALEAGLLRVLHRRSFIDDPTRAVRAARYAARFRFWPDTETDELIHQASLRAVSADRRNAELLRLAAEPTAVQALGLLHEWGLIDILVPNLVLAERAIDLLAEPPWRDFAPRGETVLAAVSEPPGGEGWLAETRPKRPSEAVKLVRGHDPIELVLARARGAEWLDRYMSDWRSVALEIDGEDLIAAGIPQGPRIGEGLAEALRRKLDGELSGRDEELRVALETARKSE